MALDGPIKNQVPRPTAVPSGPEEYDTEYYAEWEQEYAALGGPPFPPPTPYVKSGYQYGFGQIVNLRPDVDVTVATEATGVTDGADQLYVLSATWHNRGAPLIIEPIRQLVITAIQQPSGGQLGGIWTASQQALELATAHGVGDLLTAGSLVSMTLEVQTTTVRLPILAPRSAVGTVDLRFDPLGATVRDAGTLRVQFINKPDPHCAHAGTVDARYDTPARPVANNGGGGGGGGGGAPPAPGGPVPPGLAGIVNVALKYAQANRPYCYGGKGYALCAGNPAIGYADACRSPSQWPCFDCSGLTYVVVSGRRQHRDRPWHGQPATVSQRGRVRPATRRSDAVWRYASTRPRRVHYACRGVCRRCHWRRLGRPDPCRQLSGWRHRHQQRARQHVVSQPSGDHHAAAAARGALMHAPSVIGLLAWASLLLVPQLVPASLRRMSSLAATTLRMEVMDGQGAPVAELALRVEDADGQSYVLRTNADGQAVAGPLGGTGLLYPRRHARRRACAAQSSRPRRRRGCAWA